MVIDPYGLLEVGSPYRLNELYYITKQIIPALQRVFGLLGADLNKWFNEMPRPIRPTLAKRQSTSGHSAYSSGGSFIRLGLNKKASTKGSRIDTYYMSSHCAICGDIIQGSDTFCNNCLKSEAVVASVVAGRTSKLEREIQHLAAVSFFSYWDTFMYFNSTLGNEPLHGIFQNSRFMSFLCNMN
jgi:DNA polymerase zeta